MVCLEYRLKDGPLKCTDNRCGTCSHKMTAYFLPSTSKWSFNYRYRWCWLSRCKFNVKSVLQNYGSFLLKHSVCIVTDRPVYLTNKSVYCHYSSYKTANNWNTILNNFKNHSKGFTLHSVQQNSTSLKFSKPRTVSEVTYSCRHILSRFTFPIFVNSWRFSVFHSLQPITLRIYQPMTLIYLLNLKLTHDFRFFNFPRQATARDGWHCRAFLAGSRP